MKTANGSKATGLSRINGVVTPVSMNPEYPFEFDKMGNSVGMAPAVLERYALETRDMPFAR